MPRNVNDEVNFLSGDIISSSNTVDNGTSTVTISNVAPAGVGTAIISRWLVITRDGIDYFIPMWT